MVRIFEDIRLTDAVEDWSQVRSRSRAERRRKQGHPQRVRTLLVPKKHAFSTDGGRTLYMHPETAREFRRALSEQEKPE